MSEKTWTNWGLCGDFTGNLGKDPEQRFTPAKGTAVTNFSVAIKTDVIGEEKPVTTWVRVACWKELAEAANQQLAKGTLVRVEFYKGYLREWSAQGKSGTSLEVTAKTIKVRKDGKWVDVGSEQAQDDNQWPEEPPAGFEEEDEIPF